MKARGAIALVGLGALGALGITAAPASAAPSTVTAVTHAMHHADTTSVSGLCTTASVNGPVWAYDNLSLRLSVTPEAGPGNYSVTIYAHGSFSGFADPTTGDCATKQGSVDGWLQWDVASSTPPDPTNLPSQVPDSVGQGDMVQLLFDGQAKIVGGGHYSYTYNRIDGARYTQNG